MSKEVNVGLASLLELPLQSLCTFVCLVRLDLYLDLKKQMLHSWSLLDLLCPLCIGAFRGPHHFWGYKPNFGVINPLRKVNRNAVQGH